MSFFFGARVWCTPPAPPSKHASGRCDPYTETVAWVTSCQEASTGECCPHQCHKQGFHQGKAIHSTEEGAYSNCSVTHDSRNRADILLPIAPKNTFTPCPYWSDFDLFKNICTICDLLLLTTTSPQDKWEAGSNANVEKNSQLAYPKKIWKSHSCHPYITSPNHNRQVTMDRIDGCRMLAVGCYWRPEVLVSDNMHTILYQVEVQ